MNPHAQRARLLKAKNYLTPAIDAALAGLNAAEGEDTTEEEDAISIRLFIADCLQLKRQPLEALPHVNPVLEKDANNAEALRIRGCALQRLKRHEEARRDLQRAVELNPEDAVALEYLAAACRDLKDHDGQSEACDKLLAINAVPAHVLQTRAEVRLEQDRKGAEADLRAAAALDDPYSAYLLRENGFELQSAEERAAYGLDREKRRMGNQAIGIYGQAVRDGLTDPERDVAVRGRLIGQLSAAGRRNEIQQQLEDLVEKHPGRGDAWLLHGRYSGEEDSFRKALELGEEAATLPLARQLVDSSRLDEAVAFCKKRLADDPDQPGLLEAMGDAFLALERRDEAKETWEQAQDLGERSPRQKRVAEFGPEDGLDYFDRALAALNQYRKDQAMVEFEAAIAKLRKETRYSGDEADRYLAKCLYNLALIQEDKVPDEEREPLFLEAIERVPTYVDAMSALANLYLRQNRVDDAMTWFEKCSDIHPRDGRAWYYRARRHNKDGRYQEAAEMAQTAFECYSANREQRPAADAAMLKGVALEALGKLHEAKAAYDLAYEWGHPTGYASGDEIRQRIAIEDPSSQEGLDRRFDAEEEIERGDVSFSTIEFLSAIAKGDEKAVGLIAQLRDDEELSDEDRTWLIDFIHSQ